MAFPDGTKAYLQAAMSTIDLVPPEHRKRSQEYVDYAVQFLTHPENAKQYNGYYFPPGFEPETARYAYDKFKIKSGDVLIASYAKTGYATVTGIVNHILGRGDPEMLKKYSKVTQFFGFLEFGPVSKYEITENLPMERRVLGTHLAASLINLKKFKEQGAKVVYVIRNPKDQAVAWYNFATTLSHLQAENWKHIIPKDEKKFYDIYLAGKQLHFSKEEEGYLEIVREWYEHFKDENVLFVSYEEINKNPQGEIRRLAKLIGESPTEKELDWIVENTLTSSKWKEGKVGDWRNHLTVTHSGLIDDKVDKILSDTDIKFIYE